MTKPAYQEAESLQESLQLICWITLKNSSREAKAEQPRLKKKHDDTRGTSCEPSLKSQATISSMLGI